MSEYKEVIEQIIDLLDILARPERINWIIGDELRQIRDQFADGRVPKSSCIRRISASRT
jgi:DNA gyrase subunit A